MLLTYCATSSNVSSEVLEIGVHDVESSRISFDNRRRVMLLSRSSMLRRTNTPNARNALPLSLPIPRIVPDRKVPALDSELREGAYAGEA